MKLNKLLTPILGLTAVSTIVAPLATSCTTEETTTDHIKISNKSEEVTPNSSGVANYLFVLDSNEYDEHGFKVSTTVNEKDTSGVVDSDFITTWEIDGDHLLVHVAYEGEAEAPEDDVAIKLNIHINYGSEWNKTFDVKFNYQAQKGIELEYDKDRSLFYYVENNVEAAIGVKKGESYTIIVDFSKIGSAKSELKGLCFFRPTTLDLTRYYGAYFNDITMSLGDEVFEQNTDYNLEGGKGMTGYCRIYLTPNGWQKITASSETKLIITFKDCLGVLTTSMADSGNCYIRFS